tara:strand:+ start:544 stop:888 length:345 start_codon:yes stop_codon:yes gene_type:complete
MYKFTKISKYLFLFFFLCSCGIGEALQGKKRSEQGDEFLIDKKNPLAMPPDFDKLPKPGEANIDSTKDIVSNQSNIKDLLKKQNDCVIENNCNENTPSSDEPSSIESSILKKIK